MTDGISVLGNETRTLEYEADQISGVIQLSKTLGQRDVKSNDFEVGNNGNVYLTINLPIEVQLHSIGKFLSGSYTIQLEYVNDYPLSPPNVYILNPKLNPTETPHMYIDGKVCYCNPDVDWFSNYTSYEVAQMVKSWLHAYTIWSNTGVWDWPEHEEPRP